MVQTSANPSGTGLNQLDIPQEWNLWNLYRGFDDPQLTEDLIALQQTAAQFRENYRGKVSQLTPEDVANCLQQPEAINEKAGYLYAFPSLIFSDDTRNTEAKQFQDWGSGGNYRN